MTIYLSQDQYENIIKNWKIYDDKRNHEKIEEFKGNNDAIRKLKLIDSKTFVSKSFDCMIIILEINPNYKCIDILKLIPYQI